MNDLNKIIAAAVLLIAGSVAYYFVIAAPGIERDKVALERQKYEDTKAAAATEKELAEAKESERVSALLTCRAAVEKQRNGYMEMNGSPVPGKPGIYSVTQSTTKEMARIEKDGNADCARIYGD